MIFSDQRFSQSYADLRWKYFSSLLEAVDHRDYFELLGWNFRESEDIDQADNMFKYGIYLMYLNSCSRRFGCIEENLVFRSRLG